MDTAVLNVEQRSEIGSRSSNRLRNSGLIPGVVYGKKLDTKPIKINRSDFIKLLGSGSKNRVLQLKIEGDQECYAIIKKINFDNLKNEYVHLDFQQISLTEERVSTVPVRVIKGAKADSTTEIVIQQLDEIEVSCLPQAVPEYVEVDVSSCSIGDTITASDISLPDDVKLVTEPEVIIVTIVASKREEAAVGETETTEEGEQSAAGPEAEK